MSFFDRQGIPDSLLREDKSMRDNIGYPSPQAPHDTNDDNESGESSSEFNVNDDFEDDILLLRDHSLISINTDEANFEMHRLVQLATQEWLKTHSQLELWKERFIKTLHRNFPRGEFENWTRCQLLFAHVQCAVAQKPATESALGEWGSLLHEAASFAWARGNFDDGKRMAEKAIKVRKELFGPEDEKTLDSVEILGLVYSLGGQWKKAEELEVLVMEISKRVRGLSHPSTLTSMSHLASTYWQLGRWKEAEELEIQVMATRKQVLGPDHLSTLKSIGNLASIYSDQGRWKDAEELEIQVVESRRRVLGPEHPDTLAGMGNLAWTYWHQGRWDAAEELGIKVMEIHQRVLGPDHPSTLTSMGNLAWTYRHQER